MKKDAFEIFVLPGILFLMILISYGKIIGLRSDVTKLKDRQIRCEQENLELHRHALDCISNLTDAVIKLKP